MFSLATYRSKAFIYLSFRGIFIFYVKTLSYKNKEKATRGLTNTFLAPHQKYIKL